MEFVPDKLMPRSSEIFTGRQDYLKKLRDFFGSSDTVSRRRITALYGIGGIGKSQIAIKFAEENDAM